MKKKHSLYTFLAVCTLLLFLGCTETPKDTTPWVALFDGETLNGWHQKGGAAKYTVREGSIVGSTVHDTPNSFLTTDALYGDFILELHVKVDFTSNSGIQIRSNSYPYYRNAVVHGYQVEIDPSERAWSGGIYDEQRRGWLYPLVDDTTAQKAFKQNDWNHYRIEAVGDTLKTWVNGTPTAHLVDDKTGNGFICLQVHSISSEQQDEREILWKDIRIITDNLDRYTQSTSLEPVVTKNKLTINEANNGWHLLWDGSTTTGWRGAKLETFPEYGWKIENGELTVLPSGGAESAAGGDIVTEVPYGDFELLVDFKLTPGANSGIKYYVDTDMNKREGSAIGLEYQILDDALHPDAKLGNHKGSRTVSSLYDLIRAAPEKPIQAIGEWNTAYILSKDKHVEHWLNGMKVLEYERGSEAFRKLVAKSKYVVWPGFGELEKGPILLQDHGDEVSFKNIKIRPLENTK